MTHSLAHIRNTVRAGHHMLSTTNGISGAAIDGTINDTLSEICDEIFQYNEFYLFGSAALTFLADTRAISLPADFATLKKITEGSSNAPVAIVESLDELIVYREAISNIPNETRRVWPANEIELWVAPLSSVEVADAFTIYYGKKHTDLSDDADEMILPDDWLRIVVSGAKAYALAAEGIPNADDLYAIYRRQLTNRLNRIARPVTLER